MKTLGVMLVLVFPLRAHEPLAQRIAHTDLAKYTASKAVHGGAGQLDVMVLLDAHSLDTNLFFLHRGILEPKSGIGHHFHNQCEEMFVIFDGEAHSFENTGTEPLEFMIVGVSRDSNRRTDSLDVQNLPHK